MYNHPGGHDELEHDAGHVEMILTIHEKRRFFPLRRRGFRQKGGVFHATVTIKSEINHAVSPD